jgi:hypothetical protein
MSQFFLNSVSGPIPPSVPTSFVTNSGTAVPVANVLNILGTTVAAGAIPFQFIGSGNTVTGQIQLSQAIASTNANNVGLSAFNSAQFTVDANGFVSIIGGSPVDSITAGANINLTGTAANPIINLNTQILEPDGSAAAPSYSFTSNHATGVFRDTGNGRLAFSTNGSNFMEGDSSTLSIFSTTTFMTNLQRTGFLVTGYTVPGAYPYTAIATDYYISVDSSAARTINLPNAPAGNANRVFIIKDRTGNAATNNISITTPGGTVTFDGLTTYKIVSNFGALQFIFNGTNYEAF